MPKLIPIQLENGLTLYMEAEEDKEPSAVKGGALRGAGTNPAGLKTVVQNFELLEKTLSSFTHYALNAFKQVAGANVDKVTLEFGVTIGGEAGIPYVTKGSAEGNLKVKLECSFPNKNPEQGEKETQE